MFKLSAIFAEFQNFKDCVEGGNVSTKKKFSTGQNVCADVEVIYPQKIWPHPNGQKIIKQNEIKSKG